MLHALSDFIGCELRCRANAPAGRVDGFLVDDQAWVLRYVSVCLDEGGRRIPRLLPVAALPPVTGFAGHLLACLTPEELSRGLRLTGPCEQVSRKDEAALHDALHWLPYWSETAQPAPSTLHDASVALGARLSCCGEPFGTVEDLLIDTRTWVVSALCIATSAHGEASGLHLPPSFIREAHWDEAWFDCDVRATVLACAPTSSLPAPGSEYFERLQQHLRSG